MFTLNCKGRLLTIDKPIVMGIINVTPDSFYSGARQPTIDAALQKAEQMLQEGAVILDIGGQSTRPGSAQLGTDEEMKRILPVIAAIDQHFPQCFISVDTYHAQVAEAAVAGGASIINDISGGSFDQNMLTTIASMKVPYVCMHIRGTAATMHEVPRYENITREVINFFIERIASCHTVGITDIIVDPGFGFSKTMAHNFQLLKDLAAFKVLQKPLLLGVSRKSTIYKTLGITAAEALNGTTVLNTAGLLNGASILRVHDVKEAVEAIALTAHLS